MPSEVSTFPLNTFDVRQDEGRHNDGRSYDLRLGEALENKEYTRKGGKQIELAPSFTFCGRGGKKEEENVVHNSASTCPIKLDCNVRI